MMRQMILLALPVIGSSFMTMAYNFVNMIFVGNLGSDAVAAVGSASFFMHLSWGMHGDDFHYARTIDPVFGTNPIVFGPDTTMTGRENSVTVDPGRCGDG